MDPRTINFNVLRRHDPEITSLIDSTSYVVIYRYFHGAWSKTGLEGTMFIFQRQSPPLYGVFVLNRQGLDNMSQGLLSGWEVDLDEGLIIWRNEGATGDADDDVIHGLWIYEEKDRSRIATTMQSLIDLSSPQPEPERLPTPPQVSLSHPVPRVPIIPTGQSISLDQLFGVGSVCSEPPPQTSALPHPGTSTVDPEESQAALPQNVMSPDPSELPKGMQLLDSLFQKAGMKPQPSNQSLATDLSEQPVTIHQLLHQQPPTQMPSLQTGVSGPSSQQAHPHPRQRTQSPAKESYKPHSFADGSSNQVNRPTNLHPSRGEHRSSKPNSGLQQSSRRSSGGSSSHVRTDQLPNASNGHGGAHYQHQSTQQHMVPAPVPVETVNAEARHNILSLLGHPAATIPNSAFSGAGPGQMSNPGSHNSGAWTGANGSPDSIRSSGKDVYHAHTRKVGNSGGSDGQYHSTRSQQGSQQPSPQQTSQDNGVSPGRHNHSHHANPMAHPSPSQSNGSPYSSHLTHHSQKVRRPDATPPKPPLPPVPTGAHVPRQSAGQPGTIHGTNAWTYENFPKRALSPLNPASQHHSGHNRAHYAHQTQAPGSYQQPAPGWTAPGHGRKPGSYNSQSSPHTVPHTASPPLINDSSRPSRTNSVKGAAGSSSPTVSMSTKLAADVLDEVLAGALSRMSVGERDGPDDVAMDKKEFVVGILELIKNNGAFVDTLYARYLARYAEKYL